MGYRALYGRIGLSDLDIANLGSSNLGLDGDVVPYSNTSFDLGNNASSEHWDEVWAVTFNTFSDQRVKKNVEDLSYGLDAVLALRPVSYEYTDEIDPGNEPHFGLVAQEVEAVLPAIVQREDIDLDPITGELITKEGEYLGMAYMELIPVLIKSIQELSDLVSAQEDEIARLRNENEHIVQLLKK